MVDDPPFHSIVYFHPPCLLNKAFSCHDHSRETKHPRMSLSLRKPMVSPNPFHPRLQIACLNSAQTLWSADDLYPRGRLLCLLSSQYDIVLPVIIIFSKRYYYHYYSSKRNIIFLQHSQPHCRKHSD